MAFFFFFKQKTAYEIRLSLVGSEMCIRDSIHPDEFKEYSVIGSEIGIEEVVAGPLIRSSYRADRSFINLEEKKHA